MKKLFLVSLLLTVLLITPCISAFAQSYEPVKAEIVLEISRGGTAEIIPDVNCPVPEKTRLKLGNGQIGKFNIYFTDVGVYTYTVKTVPDSRKMVFDDRVYKVEIYVTDNNGKLETTVIAYIDDAKYSIHSGLKDKSYGPERLIFENSAEKTPEPPTEPTTVPPSNPEKEKSHSKNRNPKTGDDS